MSATDQVKDTESYRDKMATVDERGKRVWVYPKKPSGRFYNARTYVSWFLLAFLFIMPFIKVGGEPLLLFNILERRFILFGLLFTPQDFHLFVLAMLTLIVFIVLFTVVFGRLFCGWVCPQTIFMEMVYRKIEYWIEGDHNAQRRLNKAPWTRDKIIKKVSKQAIFFAIAVLIANTFLAYIIGVDEVIRIAREPVSMHLGGFIAMLLFSGAFYIVFSFLREQVCIAICPYGRLQGVMLDQNSIVVTYDFVRGEPRGKIRKSTKQVAKGVRSTPMDKIQDEVATAAGEKGEETQEQAAGAMPIQKVENKLGDCIDCTLCVQVCPTGIDIRDGTQLECVNCTACIDACDAVMDKIGRPRGLIRYDSYNGIVEKRKKLFTPRVAAYSIVLGILLAVNIALLTGRNDVETLILRTPGMLYQEVEDDYISNLYNFEVINKTKEEFSFEFRLAEDQQGRIKPVGQLPKTKAGDMVKGAFFIEIPRSELEGRKNNITVEVYSGGERIDWVRTTFLGPVQ
jgi:polyferredoxin